MNKKNVERMVAIILIVGTVSAVAPATNVNLLTTKAYASTTNYTEKLSNLELKTSSGSNIKLYRDSSYDDKVSSEDVSDGDTYYAKTSSSTINLSIDGPSTKYVRVFKGTSSSTKGKKVSSDISILSGITTLTVRVYSKEPDDDVRYDEDDDVISEYTIEVEYTGSDSTSTSNAITTTSTAKVSQWVQLANGKWQYNDTTGMPVKNTWFQNCFLQADGTRATEWLNYNGCWYYLGADGVKKTGWQSINGSRYYFDSEGRMQTGWLKDTDGKYYYLNGNGSMAYNTTIGGYKLGTDGAWVRENTGNIVSGEWKQDSTGWWYKEGNSYAKGWKHIGNNWYCFYSDGYMAKNIKIDGYYLNSGGAWSTNVPASFSQGVRIGMTKEQVLVSSWGRPTKINRTTNKYGTYEQWVYRYGDYNSDYLYFENGILKSIQN